MSGTTSPRQHRVELSPALSRLLGTRRTVRLRRLMRRTGLAPETLLDVALELLDTASQKFAASSLHRTAIGLGAARWRHVSPEERSRVLRRVAQARWAKRR